METDLHEFELRIVVDRHDAKATLDTLRGMDVPYAYLETARGILLDENRSVLSMLRNRVHLSERQIVVVRCLVPEASGREAVNYLTARLDLDAPGEGSITAKRVRRLGLATGLESRPPRLGEAPAKIITENLTGICCVVVKGAGNDVATIGLQTGTAVPDLSYGIGTGLRNRLGAWRILIPAEKEIANLFVASEDAATVMERMVVAGRLDEPGKGFIFSYPVDMGVLETKFSVGETTQAASLEQLIYAIDELKGNTHWRRKDLSRSGGDGSARRYLENLVDLTMTCNEGLCETLTKAAMDAGAAGATMRRLKYVPLSQEFRSVSPAREMSVMTIPAGIVDKVAAALAGNGLYEEAAAGELLASPVPRALTYLGK